MKLYFCLVIIFSPDGKKKNIVLNATGKKKTVEPWLMFNNLWSRFHVFLIVPSCLVFSKKPSLIYCNMSWLQENLSWVPCNKSIKRALNHYPTMARLLQGFIFRKLLWILSYLETLCDYYLKACFTSVI